MEGTRVRQHGNDKCTTVGKTTPTCYRVNKVLGEFFADRSEVPTSSATKFSEVVEIWLSVYLGFPKI